MDWALILTAIGTVATVISMIATIKAKNEAKKNIEANKRRKKS